MHRARDRRRGTGRLGELAAVVLLLLKGYRLEARNWRCAQGEIDLVARRGDLLAFIEVKTRTSQVAGTGEEAVTAAKRARLVRLAQVYLSRWRGPTPACRFDVIAVDASRFPPRLRHLPGAFRADGLV